MKNVPAEKVGMFFFVALFGTPIGGPPNGELFGTLSGELLVWVSEFMVGFTVMEIVRRIGNLI